MSDRMDNCPPPERWSEEYLHTLGACEGPPGCPSCVEEGQADEVLKEASDGEIAAHVGGYCWDDCALCREGLDRHGD